jgi:hypothetical protein
MTLTVTTKRVSAYRTSDGRVHENRREAQMHQAELDIRGIVDAASDSVAQAAGIPGADADFTAFLLTQEDRLCDLLLQRRRLRGRMIDGALAGVEADLKEAA